MREVVRTAGIVTLFALLLELAGTFNPAVATGKSFDIERVDITASLAADGSMDVTEAWTYDFHGTFRYGYRTIPKGSPEDFTHFSVTENGFSFQLEDSEAPGTFLIRETENSYEVRWFFSARNESRTFLLHYVVTDLVRRYEDAAVLYYQFIGDDFSQPSRQVRIQITPPTALTQAQINGWLHGPLWAEYSVGDNGTIEAWCEQLPRRTFLEINALYPPASFPEVRSRKGRVRETIMAEEAMWVAEANRAREKALEKQWSPERQQSLARWLMPALGLLGIAGWFFLYRTFGHRHSIPPGPEQTVTMPDETPPALVEYLLNSRQVSPQAIVATLMDLARRRYLLLEEDKHEAKDWMGRARTETNHTWRLQRDRYEIFSDGLLPFEDALIRFLFEDLAAGEDTIDLKSIEDHRHQFMNFFRQWREDVQVEGKKREYYDSRSIRGMKYSLVLGGILCAAAFPLVLVFGLWSLYLMAAGFVVLMLSLTIVRRTRKGEFKAMRWQAFKTYLKKHRHRHEEQSSLQENLDGAFVYGVIFRLSEKRFRDLASLLPKDSGQSPLAWYICHGNGSGRFNPAVFFDSFTSMVTVASSSVSSAAGSGGGATGGGGAG